MVICAECERYKTLSLHECQGVTFGAWQECECECEKSEVAVQTIAKYKKATAENLAFKYEALKDAINDSTQSLRNFSSTVNSTVNSNRLSVTRFWSGTRHG